jgi:hypothetical protein
MHQATAHSADTPQSLLDGGSLSDYLTTVASWVKSNPNDGESARIAPQVSARAPPS